jgi:hypothetical protein
MAVEYRSALDPADAWKPLAELVLPTTPHLFVDTNSIGQPKRFYRVFERP